MSLVASSRLCAEVPGATIFWILGEVYIVDWFAFPFFLLSAFLTFAYTLIQLLLILLLSYFPKFIPIISRIILFILLVSIYATKIPLLSFSGKFPNVEIVVCIQSAIVHDSVFYHSYRLKFYELIISSFIFIYLLKNVFWISIVFSMSGVVLYYTILQYWKTLLQNF